MNPVHVDCCQNGALFAENRTQLQGLTCRNKPKPLVFTTDPSRLRLHEKREPGTAGSPDVLSCVVLSPLASRAGPVRERDELLRIAWDRVEVALFPVFLGLFDAFL